MSLKNLVTPLGIDPGTVRLVAQRLNHYATPGPIYIYIYTYIYIYVKDIYKHIFYVYIYTYIYVKDTEGLKVLTFYKFQIIHSANIYILAYIL